MTPLSLSTNISYWSFKVFYIFFTYRVPSLEKRLKKKGFTLSILITIPQIHKKRYEYFHILNLNCVDSWKS